MATIIESGTVSDGYDIVVTLDTGERQVFHFLTPPDNEQEAVDSIEAGLSVDDVYEIEGEL